MAIKNIKITNLLSFDELEIDDLEDVNCIVGKNNVGKSNLLKALAFFYNKLGGLEELPPKLNSNYSFKGSISLTFDTTRLFRISRRNTSSKYFDFINRKLIPLHKRSPFALQTYDKDQTLFTLTLFVYSNGSVKWSTKDKKTRDLILYLFPFFYIEPRHMNLHEWDGLWDLIARIKSFNLSNIKNDDVINFFDNIISSGGENSYKKYITELNEVFSTKPSTQKEKVLSYIKAGLRGYRFEIDDNDLKLQSDGTNSFHFIKTFLRVLITISRREYITPFVFIDEPEIGLHPKMIEVLIHGIYESYNYNINNKNNFTRPKLFITTHSPSIVKEAIKCFRDKQRVFCFQKQKQSSTKIHPLNSTYDNESFINIFSDNESRLFFSSFILFVEGESDMEVFGNMRLSRHFHHLKSIDIYKSSSNVVGERINPSYSNSSIPYLFLFDADKAITIAGNPNNYTLNLEKNGNYFSLKKEALELEYRKYKFGFSRQYKERKKNIGLIIKHSNTDLKVELTKQLFSKDSQFDVIFDAIKRHLLLKNIYLNRTTIEGCLIQEASAPILYKWLNYKYNIDMSPVINRVRQSRYLNEKMIIDYLRVIFDGKTDTLVDYSSFNPEAFRQAISNGRKLSAKLKKTSRRAKSIMEELENFTVKNRHLSKTNGWITEFLNYSIIQIETECVTDKKKFGSIFKLYFPELDDIIKRLQPDSRGEIKL
ncbi:ATP-binding protein [Pseudoalteromonas sp. JC28]|uniref:retron Eco8 family effector endonuclease n=1 Tax=Pseudoalteromonas sp. JC28 TaxID=2267617 RepID=UPI001573BBDD|nr:retron Eco8 family effector endonuclease [Pseudoalteromonas sp. JC28]NSY35844.1 ATP-binding protein [Pseudoalteromonas sp. JC28]